MACVWHLRQWHRHSAISARHDRTCRPLDLRRQGVPLATGGALPQPLPCLGATCATAVYLSYFCHYARQYFGIFVAPRSLRVSSVRMGLGQNYHGNFCVFLDRDISAIRKAAAVFSILLQHATPCCACAGESVCASHSSAKGRSHQRYFRHWRHISNHPRQIPDS